MRHFNYVTALGLVFAASPAYAVTFDQFTPLANSVAGGSLSESEPFQLSNSSFKQKTLHANGLPLSGNRFGDNWDMNTLNESGPQAGRFLFTPYETGAPAGVRRLDVNTGQAVSIVENGGGALSFNGAANPFIVGDASRWTPFGTYLTAEESWGTGSTKGRLFEVTNPLGAPGAVGFTERRVIPRVSHEGLAFDAEKNMYFIDELNGGSIYKYVSSTPNTGATYFNAGTTYVMKVGAGGNFDALGAYSWEPITDADGNALVAADEVSVGGSTYVDGRIAANRVGGTNFNRPEDLEIQSKNGQQLLYFAATSSSNDGVINGGVNPDGAGVNGNGAVFSINLTDLSATGGVQLFANKNTLKKNPDGTTPGIVGNEFLNPDNIAIDNFGNIYIIEDQPGGAADIWFAYDADYDGEAESLGRWASLSTLGAEPTGLYFDPFRSNRAFVNVQHAGSDIDRTIIIKAIPEPVSIGLLLGGLGMMGGMAKRRRA